MPERVEYYFPIVPETREITLQRDLALKQQR